MSDEFSLEFFYDSYPRIEDDFRAALDTSLNPRGPDMLYDLVGNLGLPPGSEVVDIGCGEGRHALQLSQRFAFLVTGFDPVRRHVDLANEGLARAISRHPALERAVRFDLGTAEAVPADDASVDLIWCRDVLVHVARLEKAYAEFRRILRPNGSVLVYQMFGTSSLEPQEAEWLWSTMGVVAESADQGRTEAVIADAGLRVEERIDIGTEWGEWAEENSNTGSTQLVQAARLIRAPERYISRFGRSAYDVMLGDALWHIYAMVGKLTRRVYLLSAP